MIKLGVIFGGKSGEHDVSLMSAASVLRALNKEKFSPVMIGITRDGKWMLHEGEIDEIENGTWEEKAKPLSIDKLAETIDFALPIVHGTNAEDGTLQGFFEIMNIPYGGCGVLASAACMDKIVAKELFVSAGIPSCKYIGFETKLFKEEDAKEIAEAVEGYPCFVKPANLGSSVGVSKANNEEELLEAIREAAKFDRRIIVEQGMNAREIEIAVIGNEEPVLGSIGEINTKQADFYDYSTKYTDGQSEMIIPADIPEETAAKLRDYAMRAYKALDCAGFSRIDFFLDRETGELYINEINTLPGCTKFSMFPSLMADAGVPYPELIERIVDYGYERYNAKNNRQTNR